MGVREQGGDKGRKKDYRPVRKLGLGHPPNPLASSEVSLIGEDCLMFDNHSGCCVENTLKRMRKEKRRQGDWLGNFWISLLSRESGSVDCVAVVMDRRGHTQIIWESW